jgi:hypothetical protein
MDTKQAQEDLSRIKSAIYDSNKAVNPGAYMVMNFGLMCAVGFIATHFLIANGLQRWLNPLWLGLYALSFPIYIFLGYRISVYEKNLGIASNTSRQIGMIWWIIVGQAVLMGNFGFGRNFITDINFMWAWMFSIAMCMMGVIYAYEWIIGGLGIFASVILARYTKSCPYLTLGIACAIFTIIPVIITKRRLRKLTVENE